MKSMASGHWSQWRRRRRLWMLAKWDFAKVSNEWGANTSISTGKFLHFDLAGNMEQIAATEVKADVAEDQALSLMWDIMYAHMADGPEQLYLTYEMPWNGQCSRYPTVFSGLIHCYSDLLLLFFLYYFYYFFNFMFVINWFVLVVWNCVLFHIHSCVNQCWCCL